MWLVTTRGFYSAVRYKDGTICVRARAREDLEALKEVAPVMTGIVESKNTDYRYRVWMTPQAWQQACARLAGEISYPNFKDAVAKVDRKRAGVYAGVWSRLLEIQRPVRWWQGKGAASTARTAPEAKHKGWRSRLPLGVAAAAPDCPECRTIGLREPDGVWVCDNLECESWGIEYWAEPLLERD
jgi:hypothetical protein